MSTGIEPSRLKAEIELTDAVKMKSLSLMPFAGVILLLLLWIPPRAIAAGEEQVCDVRADYALGVEDYPDAIRLHSEIVRKNPGNALAHYHLGFAEGMMGNRAAEVREYQRATSLGLKNWDLFLNLGLAQLGNSDLASATESLRWAVLLGGDHFESHFNLGLVYERLGMLVDAEHEMLVSLRLNPWQPDARNTLGVIYAEEGNMVRASRVWLEVVRTAPDYEPARTNLAILSIRSEIVSKGAPPSLLSFPVATFKTVR